MVIMLLYFSRKPYDSFGAHAHFEHDRKEKPLTTTAILPTPYAVALSTLQEFLGYANTDGADVVVNIDLANENPGENPNEKAATTQAEVTLLRKVDEGWLLFIRVVGREKGSYALRIAVSTVVKPLSLTELQSGFFNAVPDIAKVVRAIMKSPRRLNT
ncbi:MAG: hypothetical protein ACOH18_04660 [Candidatus Saccharimonadaceae bacterium]